MHSLAWPSAPYLEGWVHVGREFDVVVDDHFNEGDEVVCKVWGRADGDFIENAPERPEIHAMVIWLLLHQLRSHVQRRALPRGVGMAWYGIVLSICTLIEVKTRVLMLIARANL